VCVDCGAPGQTGPDNDIILTAPKYQYVPNTLVFYLHGSRWVKNPGYEEPWYSDAFDLATGIVFAGPIGVIGAAEAAGAVGAGGRALANRMVLSDEWGVFSDKYGNRFFRSLFGKNRQGTSSYGPVRWGWSYSSKTGIITFQPRVGDYHVPSPIRIPVPEIFR
jgi:hypothetical protein